ncbi:MAG: mycofactocin system FadH/OYE family oxidoreductase 1 [Acidimicrobiales bacterium]
MTAAPRLLEPLRLGARTARNRVVFGPHETNLGRGRAVSERHVAYYRRRAAGGAGVVVVEEASVHPSDWPYERCPLATECEPGWRDVAAACRGDGDGTLVLAALGHAGGQGSSAYSQAPLWAPSRVPEVTTREVPKWMEEADIAAVIAGFAAGARAAMAAGLDGIEIGCGQHSLLRQFLSGLTNHRDDRWGQDRTELPRAVLSAVRAAIGSEAVVGLRLSCDELAPWAGITPESAADTVTSLAADADYLTVVRGAIFSVSATRPDMHTEAGFNRDLARRIRSALGGRIPVVLQGSVVAPAMAEAALRDGTCDAVEMTRAQIADARLVSKVQRGDGERIRPCILCNQACQVRDPRNPLVSCVLDPRSGHELDDDEADEPDPAAGPADVLVVGAGVAGLECARVAALRGHRVTVAERADQVGGAVPTASAASGRERLVDAVRWLEEECARLGVKVELGQTVDADAVADFAGTVVLCTGAWPGRRDYEVGDGGVVLDATEVLADPGALADGAVLVWDPIGGPIGVSVAETLRRDGRETHLATPDLIAGNELARTGDLAPANVRLQSAGVELERRSILRSVATGTAELEDRFTGDRRRVEVVAVVHAGHRVPDDALWRATGQRLARAGDAVAPRTILEAVLEGRRRALEI